MYVKYLHFVYFVDTYRIAMKPNLKEYRMIKSRKNQKILMAKCIPSGDEFQAKSLIFIKIIS